MEKFNFTTKLHVACSDDDLRPVMNCVHFVGGFAYASNGNGVIKQSLEYHSILDAVNLDGKSIHRDNYKNIMQFEIAKANEDGIECSNKDGRKAFFEYFDTNGSEIPDFDHVINSYKAKGVDFIGFKPDQMKMLMDAMYSPSGYVRVNFGGIDKGMALDVPGIPDQVAYLMPVIIESSLF